MPSWIRTALSHHEHYGQTARAVKSHALHTVCEEAACPNRNECWSRGTATFMLLGDTCTRACAFCNVKTGAPRGVVDEQEPERVAQAIADLKLRYVVLTSVNRDDLPDGGAGIFAETLAASQRLVPGIGLEILTPDFQRCQQQAITRICSVLEEVPGTTRLVWGHNMETVPELYQPVRKGADYQRSLDLLALAAAQPGVQAKSALMLGLGETEAQVARVLRDLRAVGVERMTLGQYLRPTRHHLPVQEYVPLERFVAYEALCRELGFAWVKAGPMVRSSYHAEEQQQTATLKS